MSLLLEALKKAETQHRALHEGATDPPTTGETEATVTTSSLGKPSATHQRIARSRSADVSMERETRSASRYALNQGSALMDWLTFPVALVLVLLIGGVVGGIVLYRASTAMPSAAAPMAQTLVSHTPAPTPPTIAAPSRAEHMPAVALSAQNQSNPEGDVAVAAAAPLPRRQAPPKTPQVQTEPRRRVASTQFARVAQFMDPTQQQQTALMAALEQGYQALQQGDEVLATTRYEQARQLDNNNVDAHLGLAVALRQRGLFDQAHTVFKQALRLDPHNVYALVALSDMVTTAALAEPRQIPHSAYLQRLKQLAASEGKAGGNHDAGENRAMAHFALGNAFAAQQRWDEAQPAYFNAVSADADNPDYLFNLAVSLEHLQQPRLAVTYYRQVLKYAAVAPSTATHVDRTQVERRIAALTAAMQTSKPLMSIAPGRHDQ